jgi:hypothetical protein
MAADHNRRAINYFSRSPFQSLSFLISTLAIVILLVWAYIIKGVVLHQYSPQASDDIFPVVAFPLVVWIYSLFLHWEIRIMVESTDAHPSPRLVRLHLALIQIPTVLAFFALNGAAR